MTTINTQVTVTYCDAPKCAEEIKSDCVTLENASIRLDFHKSCLLDMLVWVDPVTNKAIYRPHY